MQTGKSTRCVRKELTSLMKGIYLFTFTTVVELQFTTKHAEFCEGMKKMKSHPSNADKQKIEKRAIISMED